MPEEAIMKTQNVSVLQVLHAMCRGCVSLDHAYAAVDTLFYSMSHRELESELCGAYAQSQSDLGIVSRAFIRDVLFLHQSLSEH